MKGGVHVTDDVESGTKMATIAIQLYLRYPMQSVDKCLESNKNNKLCAIQLKHLNWVDSVVYNIGSHDTVIRQPTQRSSRYHVY